MSYDPIRTRVLEGIKEVLQSVKKVDVVIKDDDAKGSSEFIKLSVNDSVTAGQPAGAHTKRVTVFIDFHSSRGKNMTERELHMLDMFSDLLEKNPVKRDTDGNDQYFEGMISNTDTEPTEEDPWVFRLAYDASHTKVHT